MSVRVSGASLILIAGLSVFFAACSGSSVTPQRIVKQLQPAPSKTSPIFTPRPVITQPVPSFDVRTAIPAGWTDISSKYSAAAVEFIIKNSDSTMLLILRKLNASPETKHLLHREALCLLANISLLNKLGTAEVGRRVTVLPQADTASGKFCFYCYEERSLLRRVALFITATEIYELELVQCGEEQSLSDNASRQNDIIRKIILADP